MFSNRTEITLVSSLGRKVLTEDPINFDKAEADYARSEKSHGIFYKQISNLEFIGEAKQYLENLWNLYGPQAKCKLIRKEQHPTTDEWQLVAGGYLDFTTRNIKEGKLSLSFVEGGLREILTSQMQEKFELNRETDINGNSIPPLLTKKLLIKGREIYLSTKYKEDPKEFKFFSGGYQGGTREAFYPVPILSISNSDPDNLQMAFPYVNDKGGHKEGGILTNFFGPATRQMGKTVIKIQLSFILWAFNTQNGGYPDNRKLTVVLRRYSDQTATGGSEYHLEQETVFLDIGDPVDPAKLGIVYTVEEQEIIFSPELGNELKQGDSLGLFFKTTGVYETPLGDNTEHLDLTLETKTTFLQFTEDSYYPPTTSKCLTAFEVGKRLTEIYNSKPCFESQLLEGKVNTLLTDSDHNLVFAPGGWLRNLKREEENEQGQVTVKEWPIEFSFTDFYKSIHSLLPVGYGITTTGNTQRIILEEMEYFFQKKVLIKLGRVEVKERSTAPEFCFQSLKFGYAKGGEYEKPLGLDEYNTQSTFKTPLTVTDNVYEAISPGRADPYGAEDARRQQYIEANDQDSPYDRDNFVFDVKNTSTSIFEVRKWQDDFSSKPTGVYSPETAYNLNLSPARNLKRHAFWFSSGFYKLQESKIQFLNTRGNSELLTTKPGEDPVKENADFLVKDLSKNLFEPEWVEIEMPFTQSILDQINGTTEIEGRKVNNFYGLVEFVNERNRPEKAFLYTARIKDKMNFKLLKTNL